MIMNNVVRLKGDNVSLVVFKKDDKSIELYKRWYNNQYNLNMLGISGEIYDDIDEERARLYEWDSNEKRFNIMDNYNEGIIGVCSVTMDNNRVNAVLDILIGDEDNREKGYGKEVIQLLVNYAFGEFRIHRLEVNVLADNAVALKCYRNCGFVECGVMHEKIFYDNKYADIVMMEKLNDRA